MNVGVLLLDLQLALAERIAQLEEAASRVKRLQGLLPICSYCKKVRDDKSCWHQVESYVTEHTDARFSQGICPDCYERIIAPDLEKLDRGRPEGLGAY